MLCFFILFQSSITWCNTESQLFIGNHSSQRHSKGWCKESPVENTYLDEVRCPAISLQINSSRPVAKTILDRLKIEVYWVFSLLETNFLKAFIFLSSAIMKIKSCCFGNQLFEPIYFPIFGQQCLHFMIKVKNFEGSMASVANCKQRLCTSIVVLSNGIYLTSMVIILQRRRILISPQHLHLITNNLNSTNTKN